MSIFITNTLTRKKEEFKPQNPPEVKMYTCGVTVYDECHIGHARSLYIFDVIRRYLEYRKFKVNFVRNITDIDDKIINRANELKKDWKELVREYIDSYKKDLDSLGIRPGILGEEREEPRATKNIPDMIKYIEDLVDKGYAYVTDSGVYFSVRKFKDYGKLSGQSIDQMLSGVRIETDEQKQDPLDFALWKRSKPGEPSWPSPWGEGRPGWHIECSTMSMKYLDTETLDIHAGGRDLIFPHHENEIAQSEALTGKQFAKYWIHHGLLTINGQKMAKSLGNFVTIKDFVDRYKDIDPLKMFFLSSHYSHPIDYSDEKIRDSKSALERIHILLRKAQLIIRDSKKPGIKFPVNTVDFVEKHKRNFFTAMDDDFNTPRAISCLFDLVNDTNKFMSSNEQNSDYVGTIYKVSEETIFELGNKIFGLFSNLGWPPITGEENSLIEERKLARARRDFEYADKIREKLKQKGIIVEDTKDGQVWRRK